MARIRTIFDSNDSDSDDSVPTSQRKSKSNISHERLHELGMVEKLHFTMTRSRYVRASLIVVFQLVSMYYGFGAPAFLLILAYLMFTNTSNNNTSNNKLSAYSVFNRNQERMTGDRDAGSLDRQLRTGQLF